MVDEYSEEAKSPQEQTLEFLQTQSRRLNIELHELTNKLDASRGQAEQLAQRNAQVMGEVHRLAASGAQSVDEIRSAYTEALDSQQRLLTIRSQMEKLQAQESAVRKELQVIQDTSSLLSQVDEKQDVNSFDAREMIFRVMDAQEEERDRLARQMHDGPAHSLTNFILQAEICLKLFDRGDTERARQELNNLKSSASDSFQRVRDFIFDLRPMMLGDLGLVPTIKRYLEAFKSKTGIETKLNVSGTARDVRPPSFAEVLIFRGIQELAVNARDHGEAENIEVDLDINYEGIRAVVHDDGRGFSTGKLDMDTTEDSNALGLRALKERIQLVGGSVNIDSVSGQGAVIELWLPMDADSFRGSTELAGASEF